MRYVVIMCLRSCISSKTNRKSENKQIDFEGYVVVAGPFGGPIALIPNRRGLVKNIRIFNCSGIHEIGRVSWSFEERGNVVGAGWGSDEMLYVICENGELPCESSAFYVVERERHCVPGSSTLYARTRQFVHTSQYLYLRFKLRDEYRSTFQSASQ